MEGRFNGGSFALPIWGLILEAEFYGASSTPELHFKWQSLAGQANTPAPLVQKLDIAINWMNLHLVDNPIGLSSTYPLNIDLPVE